MVITVAIGNEPYLSAIDNVCLTPYTDLQRNPKGTTGNPDAKKAGTFLPRP